MSGFDTLPRYAVVEIGSNNVRMSIFELRNGILSEIKIAEKLSFPCNLGQGISRDAPDTAIRPDNLEKAGSALSDFKAISAQYGIPESNICAFATEALRIVERTNQGQQDIARLSKKFGHPIAILDDKEEANLVATTMMQATVPIHQGPALCAELGGGSLEIVQINQQGSVTKSETLFLGSHALYLRASGYPSRVADIVNQELGTHFPKQDAKFPETIIISGGQFTRFGDVMRPDSSPSVMTIDDELFQKARKIAVNSPHIIDRPVHFDMALTTLESMTRHFGSRNVIVAEPEKRQFIAEQMARYQQSKSIHPAAQFIMRSLAPALPA